MVAEPGARRGQGRIGQADVWQLGYLLRVETKDLGRDSAIVIELKVIDQAASPVSLLGQAAQGLVVLFYRSPKLSALLLRSAWQPGLQLALRCRLLGGNRWRVGLHYLNIVAVAAAVAVQRIGPNDS